MVWDIILRSASFSSVQIKNQVTPWWIDEQWFTDNIVPVFFKCMIENKYAGGENQEFRKIPMGYPQFYKSSGSITKYLDLKWNPLVWNFKGV